MPQATGSAPAPSEPDCNTPSENSASFEARSVVRHLAHELRQPLSTIESIAYYLGMVLPQHDKRSRRQVEKLQQVVQQANWILSDAIHFLQASPPAPQTIDIDEFISQCVGEAAKGDAVQVHLELCDAPTLVRSDPEQLRHLLRNVLYFFRQAGGPGSTIRIRTHHSANTVRIELMTTGLDCEPHHLQSMMEPFSPHLPAGSGLALASVRRITEVNGGKLELRSGEDGALSLTVIFPSAV